MAEISQSLQEMLDHHALRDLALRYARAIDRRDGELLLSLYWNDAIDQHGTVFEGSPAEFVAAQAELMDGFAVTAHYISNTLYRVDGDYAEGELYFVAYHRRAEASPKVVTVGGRYLDKYECRAGQWKIRRRRLIWDHFSTTVAAAEDMHALRQLGEQGSGHDDSSHTFFNLLPQLL